MTESFDSLSLSLSLSLCPVDWGCRIHRLLFCKGVRPAPTADEYPGYDTKQSDGEIPVILELWEMQSYSSLPSFPRPFWSEMLASYRILSIGSNRTKLCTYAKLNCSKQNCFWHLNYVLVLNWTVWNRTVYMYKNGFDIKWPKMVNMP